ncbi:MAG: hypothetical protein PHT69_01955 [Bacteroidales bacterium]|nr:hypothetical protein [Bacteroidales bacterium]
MENKNNIQKLYSKAILEYSLVQFKLANPTNNDATLLLFNTNATTPMPTTPFGEAGEPQFYIADGTTEYNSFVADNAGNPKQLQRIKIIGEEASNLSNSLKLMRKSATGQSCDFVEFPDNKVFVNQFQGQIAQIDLEDYTLDGNAVIQYTVPANTTIKWLLYYKEIVKRSLLPGAKESTFGDLPYIGSPTYTEQRLKDTTVENQWLDFLEVTKQISK